MPAERRIPTRTPEWRRIHARIQTAMDLSTRLSAVPFGDVDARSALLRELLGQVADTALVHPPFHSDYGLDTSLGEHVFVGHGCSFLDLGGISIGDRTMVGPMVTLITEGHPVEPAERYAAITVAPVVIGADVWIGAAATVLPGVTIGHDAVVGAGTVVTRDVPPLTVVTGAGHLERRELRPASGTTAVPRG